MPEKKVPARPPNSKENGHCGTRSEYRTFGTTSARAFGDREKAIDRTTARPSQDFLGVAVSLRGQNPCLSLFKSDLYFSIVLFSVPWVEESPHTRRHRDDASLPPTLVHAWFFYRALG